MKCTIIYAMIVSFLCFAGNTKLEAQEMLKDNFTVQVDGLGCPFCAYGLEKKFKEFKGIGDVNIEMETGVFTFSYPSTDKLPMDKVEKQVAAAGYTAVAVKVTRGDGSEEVLATTETVLSSESEVVDAQMTVAGNCGMCKARIEKAAYTIGGVIKADWNKESKVLYLEFDKAQTTKDAIEKVIANSGHDTDNAKTNKETYEALPGCCQYERN